MTPAANANRFETLRAWEGSQDRAFEELCYQLFKSDAPSGSVAIRTGNPDGGVEWYASAADGSEVGWQAKNVRGIDALLTGMTKSVKAIVRDRPKVTRVVFLISWNLNTATRKGAIKSQRQKYKEKVDAWKASIGGAEKLTFELIQASDIVDRLSRPEHRGREWFWWGIPVLTDSWLRDQLEEQIEAAEEKYRPELQVDLPIEVDIAALGFDASTLDRFDGLCKAVASEARDLNLSKKGPDRLNAAYDEIQASASALDEVCADAHPQVPTVDADLAEVQASLLDFQAKLGAAIDIEHELEDGWRTANPEASHRSAQEHTPTEARGYRTRAVSRAVGELDEWLDSREGQALRSGLYFLQGQAGSGKTHLLLESTHRALESGRPAVFLSAARLGQGDLWAGICDQLGLPNLGKEVLLGGMDAAGEASGTAGRRFVIAIDALNETPVADFWHRHLPSLRSAVSKWPHVGLVVSCRDTYVDVVDSGDERTNYVTRAHPGFAGHEVDATQKYFSHYGLQAPRIPLLVPEFSLPLFLKLFCEGLKDTGTEIAYAGHEGRVRIFQRYLDAKLARIARRLRPGSATTYELDAAKRRAEQVLDALLDEFAVTGREDVSLARGEAIAADALGGLHDEAALILGALQSEGVLNLELLYRSGGGTEQGFRILFQALADYMILRRRMAASEDPATDEELHKWLAEDCSYGILESAAVVLPELVNVELPDLLGIKAKALTRPDWEDRDAMVRYNRNRHALMSFVSTMPRRHPDAITQRTVDLLNEARRFVSNDELFRVILLMAPQPKNRLNGDSLHRHLAPLSMPVRDSYFGFATYHEMSDESSPAATLARWASKGPYRDYDAEVVELACIPLVWLLSSPNRFMRDWVTKALVHLLRGHLDVAARMLDRFWTVNDPYVVQRVVVIAYGALMRSDGTDLKGARALVKKVRNLVFTKPIRADELLLDAGRGVVEWGVANGVAPKAYADAIKRPYGLARMGPAPSEETIKRKYDADGRQPDDESYASLRLSLMSLGDFGRYVVQSALYDFSRYPRDSPYPEPEPAPERRVLKTKWPRFVRSLSEEQQEQLVALLRTAESDSSPPDQVEAIRTGFYLSLSTEQHELMDAAISRPTRRSYRDDSYPSDRACRWIFARVLKLGWTPKRFGAEDRSIGHSRAGRESHKAERWGKKYQWIAFHEMLARVADNYHMLHRGYVDSEDEYTGLHQMTGEREIDPSLPPVPFKQLFEGDGVSETWPLSPVEFPSWPPARIDFRRYGGSLSKFLADEESEPALNLLVTIDDASGEKWIVLDANFSQGDPDANKGWLGLQQPFSFHSWFVPQAEGRRMLGKIAELRRSDRHELIDSHGHTDCCYVGEIGWTPHICYHRKPGPDGGEFRGLEPPMVSSVETYCWEGNILDCSISESVTAIVPSTFVQSRSSLTFHSAGPSWLAAGEVVFTNLTEEHHGGRGFLVRASWLAKFLKANDLELVGASWHERWFVHDSFSRPRDAGRDDYLNVYNGVLVTADLTVSTSDAVRVLNEYNDS